MQDLVILWKWRIIVDRLDQAKRAPPVGEPVERSQRPEMKGPEDISDILSGLKLEEKDDKAKKSNRKSKNTISLNL